MLLDRVVSLFHSNSRYLIKRIIIKIKYGNDYFLENMVHKYKMCDTTQVILKRYSRLFLSPSRFTYNWDLWRKKTVTFNYQMHHLPKHFLLSSINKKKVLDSRKFLTSSFRWFYVLRCPVHDLTIFRKCLSVCTPPKFRGLCISRTNGQKLTKIYIQLHFYIN